MYLKRPSSVHCAKLLMREWLGSKTLSIFKGPNFFSKAEKRQAISWTGNFFGPSDSLSSSAHRCNSVSRILQSTLSLQNFAFKTDHLKMT